MADITGADRLINSIVDEARGFAAKTEEEALAAVSLIQSKCESDKETLRRECVERAAAIREGIIARELTNAKLSYAKLRLRARRELIDRAFCEALAKLSSLEGDARKAVIKKTLKGETAGGETICPAKRDRRLVSDLIAAMPELGLVLGGDALDIESGFSITGRGFYKDCSFAALVNDSRELLEPELADILYGDVNK